MKTSVIAVAILCSSGLLAATAAAHAAGVNVHPGKWETTIEVDIQGQLASKDKLTHTTKCIKPEDVKEPEAVAQAPEAKGSSLARTPIGPAAKTVYYLSDQGDQHRLNIWSFDTESGKRDQLTTNADDDVRWPSIGPGGSKRNACSSRHQSSCGARAAAVVAKSGALPSVSASTAAPCSRKCRLA